MFVDNGPSPCLGPGDELIPQTLERQFVLTCASHAFGEEVKLFLQIFIAFENLQKKLDWWLQRVLNERSAQQVAQ